MTSLTLRGVTKSFAGTPVLHGVDLAVPANQLTAVLGPSGCGKTTMLRLVAGFIDPDAGEILFGDQVVFGSGARVPAQRRRVGYVPQEGALFPHLDVAANIGFGLGRSARRTGARVDELLSLVGLPVALRSRHPHELSGGQQQRVALARALAPSPSVVLLDEPFASLDAGLREGTGRAVADALRAAGATGVLVTHDQGEALSLADHVAVMRAGRLVQVGTPREVYAAPADLWVAHFVGAAVVLPAVVADGSAMTALGRMAVPSSSAPGAVQVLLRPEQLVLSQGGGAHGGGDHGGGRHADAGAVSGVVTDVSYFGHDCAVRVQVADLVVTSRLVGGTVPVVGSIVGVRVSGPALVYAGD